MNDIHSFSNYYETLNLSFDSDLESCKRAYKKSVKQWHPDKFANNTSACRIAEDKLKEINVAYSYITEYYQKYKLMPGLQLITKLKTESESFDVSSLYKNLATKNVIQKNSFRKYMILSIFALFVIYIYTVFINPEKNSNLQNRVSINTIPEKLTNNHMKTYFSMGSNANEVIQSQGLPDITKSNIWYYGNSWVSFQNDKVSDWNNSKESPLNIELDTTNRKSYNNSKNLPNYFEQGDSKSDVEIIQGMPIRKSRDIWYYQISKIYFKNNKVISWFDSPLDPLHVKR
ncbi:MAG: J domain-containing protein [Thiohalomonadales bacterium]